MSKNALIVTAHPDDLELGCAGTVLKLRQIGYNVDVLLTTCGGYETKNNFSKSNVRTWENIQKEFKRSEQILGIKYNVLTNEVLSLQVNKKTIEQIEQFTRAKQYDILITHHYGDSHQDHRATYELCLIASRHNVKKILLMENCLYNLRRYATFKPNYYVDITNYIEKKIQAIKCYESYVTDDLAESIIANNKSRGIGYNFCYCEAFELVYALE